VGIEMENAAEILTGAPENPRPWESIAEGEYAIVELFGHTTLVGRICEIERFGAKMLAIEPVFNGKLLDPIYHGGAAIYRLSPCSREIAWLRGHKESWQLPPAIRAIIPPDLLPAPSADDSHEEHSDEEFDFEDAE
jgi:hypothetical protein